MKTALIAILLVFVCFSAFILHSNMELRDRIESLETDRIIMSQEIMALRGQITMVDAKCEHIIEEVRDMTEPYTRVIPISKGVLLMRGEEKDANKD